jgi:ankyrin repeat protein
VQLLLDRGADVDRKDKYRETALQRAAFMGREEAVQLLIDRGADVNAKDNKGGAALVKAASTGHETVVRLLLDRGADVDAKNNDGETALVKAIRMEHVLVVRLLLDRGADVDAKDNYGWTALHRAADKIYQAMMWLPFNGGQMSARRMTTHGGRYSQGWMSNTTRSCDCCSTKGWTSTRRMSRDIRR